MLTDEERQALAPAFWARVDRGSKTQCWLWKGSLSLGYGQFYNGGRRLIAHRLAYELERGEIPEGLVIDHLCRTKACVNPAHLEPVTNGENVLRGIGYTAIAARTTHCPAGHPYDEVNTTVRANGFRVCRACRNERSRNTDVPVICPHCGQEMRRTNRYRHVRTVHKEELANV